MTAIRLGPPPKQGLYDPQFEHDACGVGFVVNIKGKKSNAIVKQGICRSSRTSIIAARAAARSTPATAPASSCSCRMPSSRRWRRKTRASTCPSPAMYAAGNIFMPRNATQRRKIEEVFARVVQAEGQLYLGARTVPTDNSSLGETAKASRAVRAPGVHRPRAGDARRAGVRAQALRDPQARVQRDPRLDHRRRGVLVRRVACRTRRWSTRAC